MKTLINPGHLWNQIIFENRNKRYGAYDIRETYEERIFRSLIFGFAFITSVLITPLIISHYFSEPITIATDKGIIIDLTHIEQTIEKIIPTETKKQTASQHPTENAQPLVRQDSVPDQDSVPTPPENNPMASVGTTDQPGDGPQASGGGIDIPVAPPAIHESWQVDKMPEFEGGMSALLSFLKNHIIYPHDAKEEGIEGTAYISFIINAEGKVTNVKPLRGAGYGFDEAAVQVINKMPKWKPGMYKGEAVSTVMSIPIKFVMMK